MQALGFRLCALVSVALLHASMGRPITHPQALSGVGRSGHGLGHLLLRTGSLHVTEQDRSDFASLTARDFGLKHGVAVGEGHTRWFLHVKGPITRESKTELEQHIAPYKLGQYMPRNTFVVAGPIHSDKDFSEFFRLLSTAPSSLFMRQLHPHHKLDQRLVTMARQSPRVPMEKSMFARLARVLAARLSGSEGSEGSKGGLDGDSHVPAQTQSVRLLVELDSGVVSVNTRSEEERAVHGLVDGWSVALSKLDSTSEAVRQDRVVVVTTRDRLSECLEWLSQQKEVHWIQQSPVHELQNKFAREVVLADYHTINGKGTKENVLPPQGSALAGLYGQGQVIAHGDTGVDYDSCFFRDWHHPVPVNHIDQSHRKIVTYMLFAGGGGDQSSGHGTHTAGTLAGQVAQEADSAARAHLSEFDGVARRAKLAVYDFKGSRSNDPLRTPDDFYGKFYSHAYSAQARISSNSWGAQDGVYGSFSVDSDKFSYDKWDFLSVFAGGNYGSKSMSITSPGIAKNTLAVGSSKNSGPSFSHLGLGVAIQVTQPVNVAGVYSIVPAEFGLKFARSTVMIKDAVVTGQACAEFTANQFRDKVVFVERGTCRFAIKGRHVQNAGGLMMIVFDNHPGEAVIMGTDPGDPTVSIPCGAVTKSDGDKLRPALGIKIVGPVVDAGFSEDESQLSVFSSRGPTVDMRIKPDVTAPGESVVSVQSDGRTSTLNCPRVGGLLDMQGTSMATPVAAAAAAIVREYYLSGMLPTHAGPITPSGALVKATLIHSGVPMAVGSVPDYLQGFGRVNLASVLPSANTNDTLLPADYHTFVVVNGKPTDAALHTGESFTQCFKTTRAAASGPQPGSLLYGSAFKATLVWMDPPAHASATMLLINNLDLSVYVDGQQHLGNKLHYTDGAGVKHPVRDDVNNVEQVALDSLSDNDDIVVRVHGEHIPVGPQRFALLVTGPVTLVPDTSCTSPNLCPNSCSGSGTCQNGKCSCNVGYGGVDCSVRSAALQKFEKDGVEEWATQSTATLHSFGWSYHHVELTEDKVENGSKALHVAMERHSRKGDPDLYIAYESFPDLFNHDASSTVCEPCGQKSSAIVDHVKPGRYVIGVYGYCCDSSGFTLTVTLGETTPFVPEPIPPPSKSKGALSSISKEGWVGIAGVSLMALAAVFCCCYIWCNKERYDVLEDEEGKMVAMSDIAARSTHQTQGHQGTFDAMTFPSRPVHDEERQAVLAGPSLTPEPVSDMTRAEYGVDTEGQEDSQGLMSPSR